MNKKKLKQFKTRAEKISILSENCTNLSSLCLKSIEKKEITLLNTILNEKLCSLNLEFIFFFRALFLK